ncbi:hypothetical protein NSA23_07830 [Anaerosalibacter massiliensis]|uniref:Uncharacterized protein n=1 Tax=Anaerosalibacter massiliensis TaxID=1347392 RepID=A0A9X2MHC4_9FIRM|nr:hypothetical protein [Anaerosalibacter massiliensis]
MYNHNKIQHHSLKQSSQIIEREEQRMEYYSDPKSIMIHGNVDICF